MLRSGLLWDLTSPVVKDKYRFLDQGGEPYANPDILKVFTKCHYEVHHTGTDYFHQNGPVECAYRTISDHVRALLIGASLDIKFLPYASFHHICISNAMAMNGRNSSWIFQATGKKENLFGFWTFGCRTWIRPSGKYKGKFKHNIVRGIFLDFVLHTHRNILWYNYEIGHIGPVNHVWFNEGMNDLPFKRFPPNHRDLKHVK